MSHTHPYKTGVKGNGVVCAGEYIPQSIHQGLSPKVVQCHKGLKSGYIELFAAKEGRRGRCVCVCVHVCVHECA